MVERFYGPLTGFEMRPGERGDYVRYSDYAALEAENERLARQRDYWQSQHDERTRQLGQADAEALSRTGAVKAKAPAISRKEFVRAYAARSGLDDKWAALGFIDMDEGGRMIALPCECTDEGCEGWAMLSAESALSHLELYAPEPIRSAFRAWNSGKAVLDIARPSEQAVTEEMVEVAAKAVVAEWQKMVAETSPHMSPGDHARAFVSPGNYRLIRAALKAAMEAGR